MRLYAYRVIDIDRARGAAITFDIESLDGNVEITKMNDCYLCFTTLGPPGGYSRGDTNQVVSPRENRINAIAGNGLNERWGEAQGSSYPTSAGNTVGSDDVFLHEMHNLMGSEFEFDLAFTPAQFNNKSFSSIYEAIIHQYVQFSYPSNPSNRFLGDWYMMRSRDKGATWEMAADGAAISKSSYGMGLMRDQNNTFGPGINVPNPAQYQLPVLLTEDNQLYLVFYVDGSPYIVASPDGGDTWIERIGL